MDYATELYGILATYFTGNKARITCMTNILSGLIKSGTTNLHNVSLNMPGSVKSKSKYRRIQRFFQHMTFDWDELAKFIVSQLPCKDLILIIDRTNWKIGKKHANFLVLSVVSKGISIPIYWFDLDKPGNSSTIDRIIIMKQVINLLGASRIKAILGDREFISEEWMSWLSDNKIRFVIRIKSNSILFKGEKYSKAINSFNNLKPGEKRKIKRSLWGMSLSIVGNKSSSGELCILATNGDPNLALDMYPMRWQIESMFLCLKSKGFNLESTSMQDPSKLNVLFGLLAILTCWNCKIGAYYNHVKPIKKKNHGRYAENHFHYGMKIVKNILSNILDYKSDFKHICYILLKPLERCMKLKPMRLKCL